MCISYIYTTFITLNPFFFPQFRDSRHTAWPTWAHLSRVSHYFTCRSREHTWTLPASLGSRPSHTHKLYPIYRSLKLILNLMRGARREISPHNLSLPPKGQDKGIQRVATKSNILQHSFLYSTLYTGSRIHPLLLLWWISWALDGGGAPREGGGGRGEGSNSVWPSFMKIDTANSASR